MLGESGEVVAYRLACELRTPQIEIPMLRERLEVMGVEEGDELRLCECGGVWGYCSEGGDWVIALLYDEAFEFRCGRALVRQGVRWYYITANQQVTIAEI